MTYQDEDGNLFEEYELEEMFDQMLDEVYEEVQIMGLSYAPSTALYRLDPIAYRCAFVDYLSDFEEV